MRNLIYIRANSKLALFLSSRLFNIYFQGKISFVGVICMNCNFVHFKKEIVTRNKFSVDRSDASHDTWIILNGIALFHTYFPINGEKSNLSEEECLRTKLCSILRLKSFRYIKGVEKSLSVGGWVDGEFPCLASVGPSIPKSKKSVWRGAKKSLNWNVSRWSRMQLLLHKLFNRKKRATFFLLPLHTF